MSNRILFGIEKNSNNGNNNNNNNNDNNNNDYWKTRIIMAAIIFVMKLLSTRSPKITPAHVYEVNMAIAT